MVEATPGWKTSPGVRQPSVLRGLLLRRSAQAKRELLTWPWGSIILAASPKRSIDNNTQCLRNPAKRLITPPTWSHVVSVNTGKIFVPPAKDWQLPTLEFEIGHLIEIGPWEKLPHAIGAANIADVF